MFVMGTEYRDALFKGTPIMNRINLVFNQDNNDIAVYPLTFELNGIASSSYYYCWFQLKLNTPE